MITSKGLSPAINTALQLLHTRHPFLDRINDQMVDTGSIVYVIQRMAAWIEEAERAWVSHPDYVPDVAQLRRFLDPPVVSVWNHAPGINDSEYSYALVSLSSVLSPGLAIRMRRYLGQDSRLVSVGHVPSELHCSPFRETYYVGALGSRAQAYEARRLLKAKLPRTARKVVNAARSLNHRPKWSFWQSRVSRDEWESIRQSGAVRRRALQPSWYKMQTKKELSISHLQRTFPTQMKLIEPLITLDNFWDCATGQVHPRDVPRKFRVRQLELFN